MTERYGGRRLAEALGSVGVWSWALMGLSADDGAAAVRDYERDGYGATWFPETLSGKEVFSQSALLLSRTGSMIIAPGIANIQARDPMAMANGARALHEAFPGRFVLGLGVSHASSTAKRGGTYRKPLTTMRTYLDAMEAAPYAGPQPVEPLPVVLAALGPRMLELAAERTDGAHPYFVPVEHTAIARDRLGSEPVLAVEQTAVLASDAAEGRRLGRAFAARYLALPNYADNLRRLGWSDEDVAGPGSDGLIDAVIAWGDVDAIVARVRAHLDAGADHVCVQLRSDDDADTAPAAYRELIAGMTGA